jgi:hypothetical protein
MLFFSAIFSGRICTGQKTALPIIGAITSTTIWPDESVDSVGARDVAALFMGYNGEIDHKHSPAASKQHIRSIAL